MLRKPATGQILQLISRNCKKNLNVVQVPAIADPTDSPALTCMEVLRMMMVVKTETLWMLVEMLKIKILLSMKMIWTN